MFRSLNFSDLNKYSIGAYAPATVRAFGSPSRGDFTTYITNGSTTNGLEVFDRYLNDYVVLPEEDASEKTVLRARSYIKTGSSSSGAQYRGLLKFNIQSDFSSTVGERPFSVQNAVLSLTTKTGTTASGAFTAQLVEEPISPAVSWTSPTPENGAEWANGSGGIGDTTEKPWIVTYSSISEGNKLKFDVTNLVSEWTKDQNKSISFLVHSPEAESQEKLVNFESMNSVSSKIGDGVFRTCQFLAPGATTSVHTEGVVVIVSEENSNFLITAIDNDPLSSRNFQSFQNLVPVGATFEFRDPDTNNGINLGTAICTILDRPTDNSVLVSGITLPAGVSAHETTVEFVANTTLSDDTYILDVQNPSTLSKTAFASLVSGDGLSIRYSTADAINNSKDFTLKLASDETLYNSRYRLYLNEYVVSEDRTNRPTEILQAGILPTLVIDLLLE